MASITTVARAEIALSAYTGNSFIHDGDLRLKQPGGTRLTYHDVKYEDQAFSLSPYYGLRLTYWHDPYPNWGLALDFTHNKIYAKNGQTVKVTGTREGSPVSGPEPLNDTISSFNLSHGMNLLTLNLMHRWFFTEERDDSFLGRLQPYVGVGGGILIPHVEATVNSLKTRQYQVTGPVFQAVAGLNYEIYRPISVFGEYKFTYADAKVDIKGGGGIRIEPFIHHLIFGVAFSF